MNEVKRVKIPPLPEVSRDKIAEYLGRDPSSESARVAFNEASRIVESWVVSRLVPRSPRGLIGAIYRVLDPIEHALAEAETLSDEMGWTFRTHFRARGGREHRGLLEDTVLPDEFEEDVAAAEAASPEDSGIPEYLSRSVILTSGKRIDALGDVSAAKFLVIEAANSLDQAAARLQDLVARIKNLPPSRGGAPKIRHDGSWRQYQMAELGEVYDQLCNPEPAQGQSREEFVLHVCEHVRSALKESGVKFPDDERLTLDYRKMR